MLCVAEAERKEAVWHYHTIYENIQYRGDKWLAGPDLTRRSFITSKNPSNFDEITQIRQMIGMLRCRMRSRHPCGWSFRSSVFRLNQSQHYHEHKMSSSHTASCRCRDVKNVVRPVIKPSCTNEKILASFFFSSRCKPGRNVRIYVI